MTLLFVWFPLDFLTSSVARDLLSKGGSKLIQIVSLIEWEKLGTVVWDPADRMGSGGWLSGMQRSLSTLLTEALTLKSMTCLCRQKGGHTVYKSELPVKLYCPLYCNIVDCIERL